jgi:hypothetical protein
MKVQIPCEECICIPICANKQYKDLLRQCSILMEELYYCNNDTKSIEKIDSRNRKLTFIEIIIEVFEIIQPRTWFLEKKMDGTTIVVRSRR